MELLTRLDYHQIGRRYVQTRSTKIDPTQVDVEGSDVNIFVGSTSYMGYAVTRQLADRIRVLLLNGANGEDLDRYAYDRYQLPRKGAAVALGSVRFFRPSFAAGAGAIPVGEVIKSLTGIEYVTTTAANFTATALEATADVRAVQAGKAFQVGANQLRRFENPSGLFDPSMDLNNDAKMAGGEDVESDDVFRNRIRDFWNAARRGTKGAIEFGARAVEGVESASAEEVLFGGQPVRVVNLFIADSSGVASLALGASVQTQLDEYRAAGIAVITSTSVPEIVDVVLKLTFITGVDTTTITEAVRNAIAEYINSIPVNATLTRSALGSVLQRFRLDGLIVDESSIIEPAGDVVPTPGRTIRTTLANVSTQ
jgi:uncharacterized phage protein gp47/JayE